MRRVSITIFIFLVGFHNIIWANELTRKERELKEIGLHLREAILSHDATVILKYVANDGIPCVDGIIPYDKILNDLKNRNSWLYCYLFSSEVFEKQYKDDLYPMSLDSYFMKAVNVQIEVSFMKDNDKVISDYGCIYYKSSNMEYAPEICFFLKNGKWTFTDSPYNCN